MIVRFVLPIQNEILPKRKNPYRKEKYFNSKIIFNSSSINYYKLCLYSFWPASLSWLESYFRKLMIEDIYPAIQYAAE